MPKGDIKKAVPANNAIGVRLKVSLVKGFHIIVGRIKETAYVNSKADKGTIQDDNVRRMV